MTPQITNDRVRFKLHMLQARQRHLSRLAAVSTAPDEHDQLLSRISAFDKLERALCTCWEKLSDIRASAREIDAATRYIRTILALRST